MMAIMRKIINTNAYKVILWMFLFMMAVGSGILVNIGSEKNWAIKAYDETLSPSRLNMLIKAAKLQQEEFKRRGIVIAGKNAERDAVVGAVSGLLGEHVMSSMKLSVPGFLVEKTLNQNLGQLPSYFFHQDGKLNEEAFSKLIAPQTIEDFIEGVQLDSKNSLFYSIVDLAVYTPLFELGLQYNIDYADKEYSVMSLPLQRFIAKSKENQPSDEALEKFYKKPTVSEQFKTPEKRAGIVYRFDQSNYVTSISETEVKNYYEKNKKKYLTSPSEMQIRSLLVKVETGKEAQAKEKIESIKQKADQDPQDFEKLVKEFSDDKANASRGGLSEMFAQDNKDMDKIIVKAAFESLSKDGQVSTPLKTDRGYELIQRVKRVPAKYKELKSVESDIKSELATAKFKQRFTQDATRVINQARYNPEVLEKFIDRYKGEKKELALDVRKGGIELTHLFKTGLHKYVSFFDKDSGVILQCTEIETSKVPPLDTVKGKVLVKYHETEGKKLLEKTLNDALKDAHDKDFAEVAKKYNTTVQNASFNFKNGKVDQSPILRGQDVQSKIKMLHHVGGLATVVSPEEGLIIRLDSMAHRDEQLFGEQKKQISNTLFYAKKYQVKEGFIASLYRRAKLNNKIEMKTEVLQLLKEA